MEDAARDGATIIPLHGANDGLAGRARRLARSASRPLPGPGAVTASIHTLARTRRDAGADVDEPGAELAPSGAAQLPQPDWGVRVADALTFLRRRLSGDYAVDEYGFDPELTDSAILPLFRPLYDRWFRVDVEGVANIPATGGALLVANHAGGLWPLDAAMTAVAVRTEHPAGRHLRMLGAQLMFDTPGLGTFARRTGSTLACTADADRLLRAGELVGVWPEGFNGIGKRFTERYRLQRFGRGGFVQSALRARVPIVPVSIVGSEEIHPVLGNAKTLARMLGLPYFPITPTFPLLGPLGLLPLPSKWYIEFGAPIHTEELGADAAEDAAAVFELTDRVRETIQTSLYRLLVQRRSVWR
ncbi:lysophospholipid acyltransferase family protein [uncultured Jatrophihabitans sp.]|uniref:lysophospholipid acyltransferase family protein n=1 Tax=uncultured Jatrophihabitans sp. TaxID=1610747 RepID=UPI0035CB105D